MSTDPYPTDEELERIATWDWGDFSDWSATSRRCGGTPTGAGRTSS